jgi:VWFA-related protein
MLGAFCIAALSLATVTAQQAPKPAFSSSVDIVSVDVNVVDQQGRPVQDLGRDDFTLMVDGRVRKITSAQFISLVQSDAGTSSVSSPAGQVAAPEFTSNAAQPVRHVGVVVDRGSIAPGRARDVLAAASRFVEKLAPADRVALFTIPTGPTIDFTTDHHAVVTALQQIDGQGDFQRGTTKGIGISDALAFEKNNSIVMDDVLQRECSSVGLRGGGGSDTMICRRIVAEEANIVAAYAHDRARNTINGLRAILDRLGSSETPKTLLLVSEGLVIDNERRIVEGFARAAAAAHVTVYALEPQPSETDASQARMPATRSRDRAAREEGLQFVTAAGGGELFRVIADPDFAFARVASELSGYYLLGFEPEAGDRDGKAHAISVKVDRNNVSVRSRREFGVGLGRTTSGERAIADLLRSPIVASELPLTLTTYVFQDPGSLRVRLLVAMDIERGSDQNARTSVGMVLLDEKGAVAASLFQPEIPTNVPSPLGSQRYFATLLADPGPYTLRVAVTDDAGRRGSIERNVRAYMHRIGQFRVTELLIGDNAGESGGTNIVPSVTGDAAGDSLHTYLELFSDVPAMFARASVAFEVAAGPDGPALQTISGTLQAPDADARSRAAAASIPLTHMPAGTYVARAVISVDGRAVGAMSRTFRVVKTTDQR